MPARLKPTSGVGDRLPNEKKSIGKPRHQARSQASVTQSPRAGASVAALQEAALGHVVGTEHLEEELRGCGDNAGQLIILGVMK